jgi:hypothetical protein
MARLNVGLVRENRLGDVKHDPQEETELHEADDSHCVIVRDKRTDEQLGKKLRARKIADLAEIIWQSI